jgi:hypothetical protein
MKRRSKIKKICFNLQRLPQNNTKSVLYKKIKTALKEQSGMKDREEFSNI